MAEDKRCKDFNWTINSVGGSYTREAAILATLMDVRDELQQLNRTSEAILRALQCYNVSRALHAMQRLDKRLAQRYPLRGRKK